MSLGREIGREYPLRWLLLLNLLAIGVYSVVAMQLGFPSSLQELILYTPDAQSYYAAGMQIFAQAHEFTTYDPVQYRPFLFPVILSSLFELSPYTFWLFQFSCWLLMLNAVFLITRNLKVKPVLGVIAAMALAANAGLIGLTFHGLTEILSLFLLTVYLLILSQRGNSQKKWVWLLLLASLLTVVRPVFSLLLIFSLGYGLFRLRKAGAKAYIAVFFALAPIMIQFGIAWFNYHELFISKIGSATFRNHLAAQVAEVVHNEGLDQARIFIWEMSRMEMMDFLFDHFWVSMQVYAENLWLSFWNYSHFVSYPDYHNLLIKYSLLWNMFTYSAFFICLLIIGVLKVRNRKWPPSTLVLAGVLSLWLILTSGISFGEGDRLTTTSLAGNIVLIAYAIQCLLSLSWRK